MSMYALVGPRFNLIETGLSVTPSPAADSLFPATNIYDRIPGSIFKFGSLTSAPSVTYDLDLLLGFGSLEAWVAGSATGWTEVNSGVGHVDQEVVNFVDGSSAAVFDNNDGGAATSSIHRDVTVRAGQRLRISSWLEQQTPAVDDMLLVVRNQDTGNYLTNAGGWTSITDYTHPDPGQASAGSYEPWETDFTVESFATIGKATTTLRIQLSAPNTGTVTYADKVELIPAVTFSSVHGHNIDPRSAPLLQSSPDNSAWTTRITFAVKQPSLYGTCAVQYLRYWRHLFADTNSTVSGPIYMGEAVIGDYVQLAAGPRMNLQTEYVDPRIVVPMRWGTQTYAVGQHPSRIVPLVFQPTTLAQRDELYEMWRRGAGGHPGVFVPHASSSEGANDVIYGRLSARTPTEWRTPKVSGFETAVEELPFPFVTS